MKFQNRYKIICILALIFFSNKILLSLPLNKEDDDYFNSEISFVDDSTFMNFDNNIKIIQKEEGNIEIIKTLTRDSLLISIEKYIRKDNRTIPFGESIFYHQNGKIKALINYNESGEFENELFTYYENGSIRRHDFYKNGNLDSGNCFDRNGNVIPHFTYRIEPYIDLNLMSSKLIYPKKLRQLGIQENFIIKVFFDSTGTPLKFKFNNKNSQEFIDEIIRVLTTYKLYRIPEVDGYPISIWITLPINFRLR